MLNPETAFRHAKKAGDGWIAKCPGHDDSKSSLSIGLGDDGKILLNCFAGCDLDRILAAAHVTKADLFPEKPTTTKATITATYNYCDEGGQHIYDVCRFNPKDFRQRRADGVWKMEGVRRVLYHLDKLQGQAIAYVTEGEKDADRLRALGLQATCNVGGAGKWKADYTEQLKAASVEHVVILPDNDDPGRQHAEDIARSCHASGLEVKVVPLPDVPPKGDVCDWLDAGHTRADLVSLVKATPRYTPSAFSTVPPEPTSANPKEALTDFAGIEPIDSLEFQIAQELRKQRAMTEAKRRLNWEAFRQIDAPKFSTLRELLAEPDEPVRWSVDQLQPAGSLVLLVAQGKAGKTTLRNNLLRSLLDGAPFIGRISVAKPRGRVCVIDMEMSRPQSKQWVRDLGIRNHDDLQIVFLKGKTATFNLLDPASFAYWVSQVKAFGASYIVLDTLKPALDACGLKEREDGGRFIGLFNNFITASGATDGLICHHMGWTAERARGDSALLDAPDVTWQLARDKDERGDVKDMAGPRSFSAYGRDVDFQKTELRYDPVTRLLTLADATLQESRTDRGLRVICEVLATSATRLSGRALVAEAVVNSVPKKQADEALKAAKARGLVGFAVGGARGGFLHELTAKGRDYLASVPASPSVPDKPWDTSRQRPSAYSAGDGDTDAEMKFSVPTEDGHVSL